MKQIPKLLLALGLVALPALCAPISLNTWYAFDWTGHQNDLATGDVGFGTPAAPWDFTGAGTFQLTDIGANQQQFSVYDNNVFLASSSFPLGTVTCPSTLVVATATTCFGTSGMSTLSFALGAGSHSLTIRTQLDLASAGTGTSGSGQGFFQVTNGGTPPPPPGIPEPATMGLMGLGLGGLFLRWRTRK